MLKRIAIFILMWILVFFTIHPVSASVGIKIEGKDQGAATDIDFSGVYEGQLVGSTFQFYTTGAKSGSTIQASQASNLNSAALAYGMIRFAAGPAKTITLPSGVKQQQVILAGYDGAMAVTIDPSKYLNPPNYTGWTTIKITAANQSITLLWLDDTTGWIISGNNGCTVTY